ncbi:MAG TPA: barstar family protein [Hansschlegelia sp.]
MFAADLTGRINGASFYWRLPPDIVHTGELFSAFAKALWLPRDFQSGWDGLFACLCDFGWMTDRTIVLVHERLPKLSDAELRAYLATLRDAVRWWDDDDPHQLEVVFPESERERVNRLLGVTPRP